MAVIVGEQLLQDSLFDMPSEVCPCKQVVRACLPHGWLTPRCIDLVIGDPPESRQKAMPKVRTGA